MIRSPGAISAVIRPIGYRRFLHQGGAAIDPPPDTFSAAFDPPGDEVILPPVFRIDGGLDDDDVFTFSRVEFWVNVPRLMTFINDDDDDVYLLIF